MNLHLWSPGFAGYGGGIATFSRELALGLHDLGHDVRLIGKQDRRGAWAVFPLCGAGDFPKMLRTPGFTAAALACFARNRPDHLISTHVNFAPVAHWLKRLFGTPFTLVAHGIDVHNELPSARRAGLCAADRVIAVSAWTRKRVLDIEGVNPNRVAVLPNAVDDARFTVAQRPERLINRYKLRAGERVVLTVARLDPSEGYKGYDRIVQALPAVQAACGPVRFLLVGEGDDRARLAAMARDLRMEQIITLAGFVSDEELADHYRLADVFAMPSTGEGFGIVFLEAMACGTPVLAGNCDGSVDALDSGRLGQLIDPNDVDAIASGIIALLKQQGPALWFDKHALHEAVTRRFGRPAFRKTLQNVLCL